MTLYMSGQLDEAESELREAVGMLDKVGDYTGMFTHHFLRHIYSVRGDIPRELAEAETEIAIGVACDDAETLAWGHYGKAGALARAGRIDEALEFAGPRGRVRRGSRARTRSPWPPESSGSSASRRRTTRGRAQALEQSRTSINRTFFLVEFVGPTYPLLVESLLGPRWADSGRRAEPGRCAEGLAREPRRPVHRLAVPELPARTPCASADEPPSPSARRRQAARYLERSIAAAEKLGARYDLARALLDASLVIPEKAEEYRRRGQRLLDELGAVVPEAERLPRSD